MTNWKDILIKPSDSLEHAIKVLHDGGVRIALVADKNNKLLGTVTDGDIRRALINKLTMSSEVQIIMNNKPVRAGIDVSKQDLLQLMKSKNLMVFFN